MSEAIRDMTAILLQLPPWKPDRHINTGPNFTNPKSAIKHTIVERDPTLKARVLSALQHGGPQTSEVMAKTLNARSAKWERSSADCTATGMSSVP